ncbi:MAG: glycosyltransferase family 39 protein [Luminiphilus sp.]|nr:glycosyltransferase family 39 protein [Luminiphilus sp.]
MTPKSYLSWYERPVVLVLLSTISVVGLGFITPLFDLDEGAFTEATRELLESGNWISTSLNGEPRHDKPILIYWLQAISVTLFGQFEGAWRLPSMLLSGIWLWLTYRFGREFLSPRTGVLAVWVLASSWLATVIFKAAIADALLNTLLCWTLFTMYRYTQAPSDRTLVIAGFSMGLGFLAKGPVAVVLPLGTLLIAMSLQLRFQEFLSICLKPAAWLTVLLVITPWHVASYLDQGWAFFEGFYLGHNLGRFSDTMESHGGSYSYYLLLLPVIVLPFIRWLPATLCHGWRTFVNRDQSLDLFLWCWFGLTFVIFSASSTQLPHYLLYGLTPFFLLLARQIDQQISVAKWWLMPGLLLAAFFALFPLLLPWVNAPNQYLEAILALGSQVFTDWLGPVAVALGLLVGISVLLARSNSIYGILISAVAVMLSINFVAMPVIASAQQQPVKNAAAFALTNHADLEFVAWRIDMPSFSVYTDRIVPKAPPVEGQLVFTKRDKLDSLAQQVSDATVAPVFSEGGIVLVFMGSVDR